MPEPTELDLEIPQFPETFQQRDTKAPPPLVEVFVDSVAGVAFQNNVFRAPTNEESDLLGIFAPRAGLNYSGPDIDANVALQAEIGRYNQATENNYFDFGVEGQAMVGERDQDYARVRVRGRRDHQGIGADVDDPNRQAEEVTQFWDLDVRLDGAVRRDRTFFAPYVRGRWLDYLNADRADGTEIDNQAKDRTEFDAIPRLGYKIAPAWAVILDPEVNARFYRRDNRTATQFDRDSYGIHPRAGIQYSNSGMGLEAELTAGVAHQAFYDDARLDDITTPGFAGRLNWEITPETSLDAELARDIGSTTVFGAGGTIRTRARVQLSRALSQRFIVGVVGEAERRSFEVDTPQASERTDHVYRIGVRGDYQLGEIGFTGLSIDRIERNSDINDNEFEAFEVFWRIGARF